MKRVHAVLFGLALVLLVFSTAAYGGDAADELRKKAEQGDAEAQYELAHSLLDTDSQEWVSWLIRAGEQGHTAANRELGYNYAYGWGVTANLRAAHYYFTKARDAELRAGNFSALPEYDYCLGHIANVGTVAVGYADPDELELYIKAHEDGAPELLRRLGERYLYEFYGQEFYEEGLRLLHLAAEQGDAIACERIAYAYLFGKGVERNTTEAEAWYAKGMERGDVVSALEMASIHLFGMGVEQNTDEAVRIYERLAEQGNGDGLATLGIFTMSGEVPGQEPDAEKAVALFRRAAELGSSLGMSRYGHALLHGYGVEKDYAEAHSWFRKCAFLGDRDALDYIGYCYEFGFGKEVEPAAALALYRETAQRGSIMGLANAAYMYAVGDGVKQDFLMAERLYRRCLYDEVGNIDEESAFGIFVIQAGHEDGDQRDIRPLQGYRNAYERHDPEAMRNLAGVYERGEYGITANPDKAAELYRRADELKSESKPSRNAVQKTKAMQRREYPLFDKNDFPQNFPQGR